MDNNLLKQLIERHRRVVIPDFGAFLKKETPEGEELVFSPFLRKDDGVVTDAIVREYGVETEDARGMVAEFVIYLKRSLAASGKYYIEGVGMLAADANGAVTLREGEEPEPVVATPVEPIPEPARPVQPAVTRPQSIQVQPTPQPVVQPVAQPVVQPYPQQQPMAQPQQPQAMRPPMPQQQVMRPPMPQQQPMGQPYQPQQPMAQPQQQPQAMRSPMPQQQSPSTGQAYPQQPQQPMGQPYQPQQQAMRPPMPPSMSQAAMGMQTQPPPSMGQASAQSQQPQQRRPAGPGGPNGPARPGQPGQPGAGGPPQQGRRPQPHRRNRAPRTKADVWLIVAIVAALVVIAIMIYGFVNTGQGEIDMDAINAAMAPAADSTTVVDDAAGL